MTEQMSEFQALFAGFLTGSAVKYMAPVTVELIDDEHGNHTGYFYVTHAEGERLLVRTDPVPRCPGCATYAVWGGDHWETAHKTDCSWMLDPQSEAYA